MMVKRESSSIPLFQHSNTPLLYYSAHSLERLDQRLTDFVDISCSQSQHDVTGIEFSGELLGDLALVRNKLDFHVSFSFNRLIQCLARHPFNRILSRSIDLRKNEAVGALEGG